MAQIGTIKVQHNGNTVSLPVFEEADVDNDFLKLHVGGSTGCLPMYPVSEGPTHDFLRIMHGGTVYGCHDQATMGPTYGSTVNLGSDESSYTTTDVSVPSGVRTNPNTALAGYEVTISNETSGATRLMLYDEPSDTILTSTSISTSTGSRTTAQLQYSMSSGTNYDVLVDNNGNAYDRGEREGSWGGYPVTSSDFDVTDGKYTFTGESASTRYSIHEIVAIHSF